MAQGDILEVDRAGNVGVSVVENANQSAEQRDSIPRVQHIVYFQEILQGIAAGASFDGLRARLRAAGIELARRLEGRVTSSRVEDAYTLWNPTVDAIGEMMRLGLVEHHPLPSKRAKVDDYRSVTFALTKDGRAVVDEAKGSESGYKRFLTPRLLAKHHYFSPLCALVAAEESLVQFKTQSERWTQLLGEDAAARIKECMKTATVSADMVTARLKEALQKRFPKGSEPTRKNILDTVKDALAAAALESRGLRIDGTTFDILMKWGTQLFLMSESRYVPDIPQGRMIWATAAITLSPDGPIVARRGLAEVADAIVGEIAKAYRYLADALSEELGGASVRYPYLEIFKVRALVAYHVRVNNAVVDRVIAEVYDRTRKAPYRVELALGEGRWQASSETPFRIGTRRFYVILVKPEGE
jgi:hypothetical protein